MHKRKYKGKLVQKEFVDDYAFDLGYHHSYILVIFTIGLIFSPIVPLISIFAFLFFILKYCVDKYNLCFVYNKEFEGCGIIKAKVLNFTLFSIYLFQFLNMGFFSFRFGQHYLIAGIVLITLQTLAICILRAKYIKRKIDIRQEEAMKNDDEEDFEVQLKEIDFE